MNTEKDKNPPRIVLVGTYKSDQLARWPGWYNYPVASVKCKMESVKCGEPESGNAGASANLSTFQLFNLSTFQCINELWLFQGTKDQKNYKAEFIGVKTRDELVRDYGYTATGKPHGDRYALFKTELLYRHKNAPQEEAEAVIVTRLRPEQLRVCEAAVQLNLFSWEKLQPVHLPKRGELTAVELFAGAGGLSIGLERAGIHYDTACPILNAADYGTKKREAA